MDYDVSVTSSYTVKMVFTNNTTPCSVYNAAIGFFYNTL